MIGKLGGKVHADTSSCVKSCTRTRRCSLVSQKEVVTRLLQWTRLTIHSHQPNECTLTWFRMLKVAHRYRFASEMTYIVSGGALKSTHIVSLKKVAWWNVVPVWLMWVTLTIFECVTVESNECIHFHMRIHITKIMSIIIIIVFIAYRLTTPVFSTIVDRTLPVAASRLWKTVPQKTSRRRHKCLFFGNGWRPISSVIFSPRQIFCSACAVTVI